MSTYVLRKGVASLSDLTDANTIYGDPGMGKTFYVNGGSDGPTDNNGNGSKEHPFQTIKAALAKCTSGNDDYIYVMNYGSNARAVEDWPILVTKDQVHIMGVRATNASKWATVTSGTAGANAFTVSGQRCEFANLEIGGATTGVGIQIANGVWGTFIHDCWFGIADGVGASGVYVAAGADAPYLRIEDCEFGAALTVDGILCAGNMTRGTIRGNQFNRIVGIAINVTGSAVGIKILANIFNMAAQTAGDAITLATGSSACIIHNNHAMYGKATDATKYWVYAGSSNDFGWNTVNGVLLQC